MTNPVLVGKLSIRSPAESVNETEQNSKSRRITWDCEVAITSKRCRCLHKVLVRIGSNPVRLKLVKLQYRFAANQSCQTFVHWLSIKKRFIPLALLLGRFLKTAFSQPTAFSSLFLLQNWKPAAFEATAYFLRILRIKSTRVCG